VAAFDGVMFQTIAIHHADPRYVDDFKAFMRRVMGATEGAPGLIEFTSWQDASDQTRLMGMARWESEEHFTAGLSRITSLAHERREEWSTAPDELVTMTGV
jgi:heme-degrading monooxygenase HmoA